MGKWNGEVRKREVPVILNHWVELNYREENWDTFTRLKKKMEYSILLIIL